MLKEEGLITNKGIGDRDDEQNTRDMMTEIMNYDC